MWREHGEGSRLDLADVFTDSAGEGGWAWSLLSLSWNLLVFLESNFCVPQNRGRPKALATGPRV